MSAEIRRLLETWRQREHSLGYGCLDGTWAIKQCADELEALLPALPPDASRDFDAIAAAIVHRGETKAPSQIEWEIAEALRLAYQAGLLTAALPPDDPPVDPDLRWALRFVRATLRTQHRSAGDPEDTCTHPDCSRLREIESRLPAGPAAPPAEERKPDA